MKMKQWFTVFGILAGIAMILGITFHKPDESPKPVKQQAATHHKQGKAEMLSVENDK